jgi:hypothetical protein
MIVRVIRVEQADDLGARQVNRLARLPSQALDPLRGDAGIEERALRWILGPMGRHDQRGERWRALPLAAPKKIQWPRKSEGPGLPVPGSGSDQDPAERIPSDSVGLGLVLRGCGAELRSPYGRSVSGVAGAGVRYVAHRHGVAEGKHVRWRFRHADRESRPRLRSRVAQEGVSVALRDVVHEDPPVDEETSVVTGHDAVSDELEAELGFGQVLARRDIESAEGAVDLAGLHALAGVNGAPARVILPL